MSRQGSTDGEGPFFLTENRQGLIRDGLTVKESLARQFCHHRQETFEFTPSVQNRQENYTSTPSFTTTVTVDLS